jgi:hypothetical protein
MTRHSLHFRACLIGLTGLLSAVSAGCSRSLTSPVPPAQALDQAERAELDSARSRWTALGLQDYQFETRKGCLCPPAEQEWRHVEVRGGRLVAVIPDGTDATTLQRITEPGWWTIDELFDLVRVRGDSVAEYDLKVSYDGLMGYPTAVREVSATPDGGSVYFVKDVKPLH